MDVRERVRVNACGCRMAAQRAEEEMNGMPYVPPIAPHDTLIFQRTPEGPQVILRHNLGETVIRFDPRYARHSPTGFEWGYGGSGPAELSRYLTYGVARYIGLSQEIWDALDYQEVKWRFVARIPHHGGGYHASEIYEALGLSHYLQDPEW